MDAPAGCFESEEARWCRVGVRVYACVRLDRRFNVLAVKYQAEYKADAGRP